MLTTNGILNTVPAFTIAGWINPASANFNNMDLFGQRDVVQVDFATASKLEVSCAAGTKKVFYTYPYGANAWHHIAGVGDGTTMYLYLDGVQVDTRAFTPAPDYGASIYPFNIGAMVSGTGNYFKGLIDEVVVYNRALSAAEIGQLYLGQVL